MVGSPAAVQRCLRFLSTWEFVTLRARSFRFVVFVPPPPPRMRAAGGLVLLGKMSGSCARTSVIQVFGIRGKVMSWVPMHVAWARLS
jgi:hypothetical protein